MEGSFKYFVNNNCLVCEDSYLLSKLIEQFDLEIIRFRKKYSYPPKIILNERQPVYFLAGFIAACKANCSVFLCNPDWKQQEWLQILDLVKPDIIWGIKNQQVKASCFFATSNNINITNYQLPITNHQSPHIMIPTGGSSGKIKFAVHSWDTLTASVRGFQQYFETDKINSFCVLPLYHVSGLMQFLRCLMTGGKLVNLPFKLVKSSQIGINSINSFLNNIANIVDDLDFFISLVPTQLELLLQQSDLTQWLSKFQTVLLGGGPAWDELLQKARFHHIRLAPTYGMTETASQIATMKPDDFLKGKVGCGQILPHASVQIRSENQENLKSNQIGRISIKAESLALGYYPLGGKIQNSLQIDDLAFLDAQGYLNIVGRNSDKIITGGENVYPLEVEAAIRATGIVADVCVIGLEDKHWGQVVTAIYVVNDSGILNKKIKNQQIQDLLKDKLTNYKIPKVWISVDSLPRNAQGKINRQMVYKIAVEYIELPTNSETSPRPTDTPRPIKERGRK
ncbi:AMP-dependent synthetase and ligase [Calothrix parasitica NIES-267]|uniref:AMP-dependent synthetase and ligase n=1 Tax=Calothrix parasitica NIES-267 TaxID=1973488 RepID=A0A1Z4LYW6_9CYAN|nr:AMP-dependent synthetase and ligase [Calothrix parasitica NIES-267]